MTPNETLCTICIPEQELDSHCKIKMFFDEFMVFAIYLYESFFKPTQNFHVQKYKSLQFSHSIYNF